jgi:hypothetical protein
MVVRMDKEMLARKLYAERVTELMGDHQIDSAMLDELWDSRTSPADAVKAMSEQQSNGIGAAPWLNRYLNRR